MEDGKTLVKQILVSLNLYPEFKELIRDIEVWEDNINHDIFLLDENTTIEDLTIWHDISLSVECFVDVNSSDDHVNFIKNLCKEKIKNFIEQKIQYWEKLLKALN